MSLRQISVKIFSEFVAYYTQPNLSEMCNWIKKKLFVV